MMKLGAKGYIDLFGFIKTRAYTVTEEDTLTWGGMASKYLYDFGSGDRFWVTANMEINAPIDFIVGGENHAINLIPWLDHPPQCILVSLARRIPVKLPTEER
jgi:hypothetical protein